MHIFNTIILIPLIVLLGIMIITLITKYQYFNDKGYERKVIVETLMIFVAIFILLLWLLYKI